MYKIKIFLLLFIGNIINFHILSQENVIFEDDFSRINVIWQQYKKNKNNSTTSNGKYNISSSSKDALRWFGAQIFIDYTKDFSIEVIMRQLKGSVNQGYGMFWGAKGWQNSHYFVVSSSGYFNIGKYVDSRYVEVKNWTKIPEIKPKNLFNKLEIVKTGHNIIFYINDKAVHTTRFTDFFGQMHGFFLQSGIKCQVDNFKVTNELLQVQLADISFKGKKRNIGNKINTRVTEIAPIISPDGQILYFARGNHQQNYAGYNDEADIWYSKKQSDGTWGTPVNIGKPLNNSGVNVVVNAAPDGNTLFLEGLYNSDGSFKSDEGISVTHKTTTGWSVPKQVKIDNFYNHNIYETYFFTPDQKVLILSVERDDSYGDLDLYVSFRRSNGTYTRPKNIGAKINTFGGEGTPFMGADGTTLYFSTGGLKGYGSKDIYMTTRLDDTWLNWSKPKNLGPAINTNDWDTYFSLSAKGDTAFLVSASNSIGREDIFTIHLSPKMQPDPVVLISGKVLNIKNKKPIKASIKYFDIKTKKEIGIAQSNPKTGEYKIILPYGKHYSFRAEAENYIAQNENIDLRKTSKYKEITKNLLLAELNIGETIILNNVFFEKASDKLLETSYAELDRIVKILTDNPTMLIELGGHTDNRGNASILMQLSKDRIEKVKNYLVEKNIDQLRIKTKAYGGTKPIHKNNSEAEHARNRRVEFIIIKK